MFKCPSCDREQLVGEGWIPPPCIFKQSNTIKELSQQKKCVFTHIECECGQHVGVQVISGPKRTIGFWRIQFDCEDPKDQYIVPCMELTDAGLKHIYQVQLMNCVHKTTDVLFENKEKIFTIEQMVKKFTKKPRRDSIQMKKESQA